MCLGLIGRNQEKTVDYIYKDFIDRREWSLQNRERDEPWSEEGETCLHCCRGRKTRWLRGWLAYPFDSRKLMCSI